MKKLSVTISLFAIISFVLSLSVQAQEEKKVIKEISAKDKATIIDIFKTIESPLYRIEFNSNETYGSKFIGSSTDYLRVGKYIGFLNAIVETYYPAMNFWFVVMKPTPPAEGLEGIFGKQNAAKLKAVINKYTGGQ